MPAHPANSTDAHLRLSLSPSSLPRRDYQSLRLVIFALRLELPRCRRNVTDARCVPQLRDCAGMVPQVRPDLRQRLAPQVSFKSAGHAQRFLSAFGIITSHFRVGRHLYRASAYRAVMKSRFAVWEEGICVKAIVN